MDTPFNPSDYLNAEELAAYLGCTNVLALRYERRDRALPAPDTVFEGRAYWSRDAAKCLFAERHSAISQAFGHPKTEPSDAPEPLIHPGVARIRVMEGRWDPRPSNDDGSSMRGWA